MFFSTIKPINGAGARLSGELPNKDADLYYSEKSDRPVTPREYENQYERGITHKILTHCSFGLCSTDEEDGTSSPTVISLDESETETGDLFVDRSSVLNFQRSYRSELPDCTVSDEYEPHIGYCKRKAVTPWCRRASKHRRAISDFANRKTLRKYLSPMYLRPRNGRTSSGTEVIASIVCLNQSLAECYASDSSSCVSSESRSESEQEFSRSSSFNSRSELNAKSARNTLKCQICPEKRVMEMKKPCPQIMVSGGPRAGFYDLKKRIQGRRSWGTAKWEIRWSVDAKAWLLRSKGSRRGMCVAMLKEDTINPCTSPQPWRVSLNGRTRSMHDAYAFKPDRSMLCTPSCETGVLGDLPEWGTTLEVNTVVRIRRGLGVARFIGPVEGKEGIFVGVELFTPTGLHNGTRNELFYFEARPNHGIFVSYPGGIIEQFGWVSQKGETAIENVLTEGKKVMRVTSSLENRVIKKLIATCYSQEIFCAEDVAILGTILLYDLVMLC